MATDTFPEQNQGDSGAQPLVSPQQVQQADDFQGTQRSQAPAAAELPPEHLRAGTPQQEQQVGNSDVDKTREQASAKVNAELDKLAPYKDERIWILGKPPEMGGKDDEWLRLYQRPLGYMAKMRFFSLLSDTITKALEGGTTIDDLLSEAGVVRSRGGQFSMADFGEVASIMPVAMRLVTFSPDFLLNAYCILLDIPGHQRPWARAVMEQSYYPEGEKWGLTDDQGVEIIEIAIEQNYEKMREFFVGKLPRVVARVRSKEEDRKSESAQ